MENDNFDCLIQNITGQLKDYIKINEEENNDYHKGIVHGMYFVADSIQNMLIIQNEINDENKYPDFINLVEEIEQKYILEKQ